MGSKSAGEFTRLSLCERPERLIVKRTAEPRPSIVNAAKMLLTAGLLLIPVGARADDASPWTKGHFAQTRLVAGEMAQPEGDTQILAGVQIKLDNGWKTYWRNPGDSGLPPSFDWSESKNLKSATVRWPAPHRFRDPYGTSIGYSKEVVFPVDVTPVRAGEPVELKLKLEYAVCKDICVPAQDDLSLNLEPGGKTSAGVGAVIWRYLSQVPAQPGEAGKQPRIETLRHVLEGSALKIVIEASFPNGIEGADLFADGGDDVYLPPPELIDPLGNGRVRFTIKMNGDTDVDALRGRDVTWTLVSNEGGSEEVRRVK